MNPDEFVKNIKNLCIDENIDIYKDIFNNTDLQEVEDGYWKLALPFFKSLKMTDKQILFSIIRQTQVDTLSTLFSVLDGVSWLDGQKEDFKLHYGENKSLLNGDLQDIFLESEEE